MRPKGSLLGVGVQKGIRINTFLTRIGLWRC